jgi:bifunctional DNA-binding transcriptional regulator/antitoxin component of YhaV-PrlF toxin-antitoxin module
MSKVVTTIDQHSSITLPPEAIDALGIELGAELEVESVGRALVIRSVEEAKRSRDFMSAFEAILSKRRTAYEDFAKGPDR